MCITWDGMHDLMINVHSMGWNVPLGGIGHR